MKLNLLWPTPVWEFETPELLSLSNQLMENIRELNKKKITLPQNIFDKSLPASIELEKLIHSYTNEALIAAKCNWRYSHMMRGRVNMNKLGEWDSPHIHIGPKLVGVLYLRTPESSGNLILIAPTFAGGLTSTSETSSMSQIPVTKQQRTYFEVVPQVGKMVLFPSDLVHFVMPNTKDDTRVSVALNIELQPST